MKKILLCASLMALYGFNAQAVTFEIKDETGDKKIVVNFYAPPAKNAMKVEVESGPDKVSQKDLVRYFQRIKDNLKTTVEISAGEARCWPINLEKYDEGTLDNMTITVTRDHSGSTCKTSLDKK